MKNPDNDNLPFVSVEQEIERTYFFEDGSTYTIQDPQALYVSASGGHRVLDGEGQSHYIQNKWNALTWKVRMGTRPFIGFGEKAQELDLNVDLGL